MDLFKLRAVIGLDTSEYERGLKNSSSLFSKTAGSITKTATKVGKAVAVGLGAAATAVGALVKQSVQAFADYEQLVGGVETLFGTGGQSLEEYADAISKSTESVKQFQKANGLAVDGIIGPQTLAAIEKSYKSLGTAQATVLKDASEAYRSAGLSANEYMETVTGFSASLIASLGGDTQKAASYANQAIIDMSDNANKMGTDIESIQYAYQGFAKQNYTMLDNLKLGYGGTKEEMQRLLADAEKLTGKKFDLSNFADVTEAIHAIQTEMGITGTTALEASTTISGSIASMKASWSNLLTAISADDLPFNEYVENFASSAVTVADNLIPRIGIALKGVASLISQLAPTIANVLPGMFEQLLPPIIAAAAELVGSVVEALPGLIEQLLPPLIVAVTGLVSSVVEILPGLIDTLAGILPTLIDGAVQILTELVNAIVVTLPTLLPALADGILQLVLGIAQALPQIIQTIIAVLPDLITNICDAIMANLPQLIAGATALVVALVAALPQITAAFIKSIPVIISTIIQAVGGNLLPIIDAGKQILLGLLQGMLLMIAQIFPTLVAIFEGIVGGIKSLFGIHSPSTVMMEIGENIMQGLIDGISALLEVLSAIWETIKTTTVEIWSAIYTDVTTAASDIWESVTGWFSALWTDVTTFASDTWADLTDTWNNIYTDITTAASDIWESVTGWFSDLWTDVTTFASDTWTDLTATWTGIGTTISTAAEDAWTSATTWFSSIYSDVTEAFNNLWTDATTIWESIKTAITTPIEDAKTTIGGIVDDILDFFDVEIEWPDIPLPHFSITPKGWSIGDLLKGKLPSLGISWYNRAMNNPMLLRGATIFGMQDGQFLGGGDAGGEVVAGANTVARLIHDAVRSAMSGSFGGIVVNQNIYSEAKTAADLMQEARWEAERAVLTGV